ncbi:MAG: hypothetical protein WAV45_00985 [Propionibacteriaceae bacterium]|jgi:hypothetical protein|nr:hypothetical protein [Micropruina sp.]HBX82019.1 hypothetical protein [Propionibacteriaceae bacterium]HBY24190.1 hypothetical protein [Propionibacteriaceae bacterium]
MLAWVFVAIALGGLVVMVAFAIRLAHQASDLFSEVAMLGTRVEELGELVSHLDLTGGRGSSVDRYERD